MAVIIGGASASGSSTPTQTIISGIASSGYVSMEPLTDVTKIVKNIVIVPTTSSTQYKLSVKEKTSGYYFIRSGVTLMGTQVFMNEFVIINDKYVAEIFAATADELFNIYVRFG